MAVETTFTSVCRMGMALTPFAVRGTLSRETTVLP
jgi:hypothetical protein